MPHPQGTLPRDGSIYGFAPYIDLQRLEKQSNPKANEANDNKQEEASSSHIVRVPSLGGD
ncbi:MAG: hypothetical protein P8M65_08125 [Roseibacillus sp.]|nr:hypothetical protein [Roseibacillus sp.]